MLCLSRAATVLLYISTAPLYLCVHGTQNAGDVLVCWADHVLWELGMAYHGNKVLYS